MFDISWSEILVLGIVALIVVGPKELPTLLRTVGRYMGMIRRQAAEFRAQFDEAMRESELDQIRKDVEGIKTDAENTIRDAGHAFDKEMSDARREFETAGESITKTDAGASAGHDANGMPIDYAASSLPLDATAASAPASEPASGAGSAAVAAAAAAAAATPTPAPAREPAKSEA